MGFCVHVQLEDKPTIASSQKSSLDRCSSGALPSTANVTEKGDSSALEALLMKELNCLGQKADLRSLIPKLACSALHFMESTPHCDVFDSLVEPLLAFKEGTLQADSVPATLPVFASALKSLSADTRISLAVRFKEEVSRVLREVVAEQNSKKNDELEVHLGVTCDGCNVNPIVGDRYKRLAQNKDLCKKCYQRVERDPRCWVPVRSETTGTVIGSYYGECSQSKCGSIQSNIICDGCNSHIVGRRLRSLVIPDYDLCDSCYKSVDQSMHADFEEVTVIPSSCLPSSTFPTRETTPIHDDVVRDVFEEVSPSVLHPNPPVMDTVMDVPVASPPSFEEAVNDLQLPNCQAVLAKLIVHHNADVRHAVNQALEEVIQMDVEKEAPVLLNESVEVNDRQELLQETTIEIGQAADQTKPRPKVMVVNSEPLVLGIEAYEVEEARGIITGEWQGKAMGHGATEAFCVGRVVVPVSTSSEVPVYASVTLKNEGEVQTPITGVVTLVSGDAYNLPLARFQALAPGQTTQVLMDLVLPPQSYPHTSHSEWIVTDATTGERFGPLLVLEVVWER